MNITPLYCSEITMFLNFCSTIRFPVHFIALTKCNNVNLTENSLFQFKNRKFYNNKESKMFVSFLLIFGF